MKTSSILDTISSLFQTVMNYSVSRPNCFTAEGQNPSVNFLYTGGGARLDSALLARKKPSSCSSSASDTDVR